MHVNFLTIGQKDDIQKFIEQLSSKYLPFQFMKTDINGKFIEGTTENYNVQILVRPIQLWDVIFPEQHKDLVLNTIFGDGEGKVHLHESANGKKFNKFIWALKKVLHLEDMPTYAKDKKMPIHQANTHFIALGIKDDRKTEDGKEML